MPEVSARQGVNLRGVKIRTFNYWIIIAACVLYALLLYETVTVMREYEHVTELAQDYRACTAYAEQVHEGSDYLTEQVRFYVILHENQYAKNYFHEAEVTRRRDLALEQLNSHDVSETARMSLASALECSNYLMQREIYAMRLVAEAIGEDMSDMPARVQETSLSDKDSALSKEEKLAAAEQMVFDNAYQDTKALILSHISHYLTSVVDGSEANWLESEQSLAAMMTQQRICISLLFVLTVVTFIMIIILIIKPLNIYINCIKDDKLFEIMGAYEFKYLALTYNNIYELNAKNEEILSKQANTDHLTGLVNRAAFDHLTDLMRGSREPMGLLICDADKFKDVNDTYGHETGDAVLKKISACLAKAFRSTDTPARIGGDEFAVVLPNLVVGNKHIVENKIKAINEQLALGEDGLPPVSISAGCAFSLAGYNDNLYTNADRALYSVKEHGRAGCGFYRDGSN